MGVYKALPGLARHVNRTSGGYTCCAVIATWAGYILVGWRCLIMAMFVSKWTEISQVVFLCTELQLADGAYADYIAHNSVIIIRTFLFEIEMQMCGQFCTRLDASKQQKHFFPSTTDIPYKGLEYKCLQTARAAGCCGRAAWQHFAAHFAATIERELNSTFIFINSTVASGRSTQKRPSCGRNQSTRTVYSRIL